MAAAHPGGRGVWKAARDHDCAVWPDCSCSAARVGGRWEGGSASWTFQGASPYVMWFVGWAALTRRQRGARQPDRSQAGARGAGRRGAGMSAAAAAAMVQDAGAPLPGNDVVVSRGAWGWCQGEPANNNNSAARPADAPAARTAPARDSSSIKRRRSPGTGPRLAGMGPHAARAGPGRGGGRTRRGEGCAPGAPLASRPARERHGVRDVAGGRLGYGGTLGRGARRACWPTARV